MEKMRLGRTNLFVGKSGFGALPIQRISMDEAVPLLQRAFECGMDFFDTARYYSDSEEKIGNALSQVRGDVVIATKAMAATKDDVLTSLSISLEKLQTDYVDILQLHNPASLPDDKDPESAYAGLVEARENGLARFIGVSCHRLNNALEATWSGLYDTVQFPLSSLSSEDDLALAALCRENDCGLIAMKALSGGLISNAATSFAFLRQFENVLPIWGIQYDHELDEFLALEEDPPALDEALWKLIRRDRMELAGLFCRGCGYCMPCPEGIEINWAARMSLLLRRAPAQGFMTDEWRDKMRLINSCTRCGQCRIKCPYGLDTPALLEKNLEDYERFYASYCRKD
jgi:Predicted oxidoreductases (related to aryl-alcohol dehydrogenases)